MEQIVLSRAKSTLEGPVNTYLQNSYLNVPLNKAMDVTEHLCDRYLPEIESDNEEENNRFAEPEFEGEGPVFRAGKLSKKFKRQAFSKLKNLNLRNTATNPLPYCVDLINYAATNFDPAVAFNYAVTTAGVASSAASSVASSASGEIVKRVKPTVKKARATIVKAADRSVSGLVIVVQRVAQVPRNLPVYVEHVLESPYARVLLESPPARAILERANWLIRTESVEDAKRLALDFGLQALERVANLQETTEHTLAAYPIIASSQKLILETGHRFADPVYDTIIVWLHRLETIKQTSVIEED